MHLARAGADIAIHYSQNQTEAVRLQNDVEELGLRASVFQADFADDNAVRQLAADVPQRMEANVAILVNNAGIGSPKPLDAVTLDDWDSAMNINARSAFILTQAVLPVMRDQKWGRLLFISSVAAQVGGVVGPHYAASKAAMIGLAHSYANLLVKEGITSNAIAPALIETDMVTQNLNAKPDLIPVGRFGTVDETAQVAAMLATNGYVTGQTINVNGGWYMSS